MFNQSRTRLEKPSEAGQIEGTGSFVNELGQPSLMGNILIRPWRHGSKAKGFMTFFAVLWNGILLIALSLVVRGPYQVNGIKYDTWQAAIAADPLILMFLLHPLIGIVVAYLALALWINKSLIRVNHDTVERIRGPLPWIHSRLELKRSEVLQFYIEMYSSHTQNDQPVYAYCIMAQMKTGPQVQFESGIASSQDARILERWLESKLGIQNNKVHEELAR